MSKETWTPSDERKFQELLEVRTHVIERNDSGLRKAAGKIGFTGAQLELLIAGLRDNAESIRDALEPFDSGVRCSSPEES